MIWFSEQWSCGQRLGHEKYSHRHWFNPNLMSVWASVVNPLQLNDRENGLPLWRLQMTTAENVLENHWCIRFPSIEPTNLRSNYNQFVILWWIVFLFHFDADKWLSNSGRLQIHFCCGGNDAVIWGILMSGWKLTIRIIGAMRTSALVRCPRRRWCHALAIAQAQTQLFGHLRMILLMNVVEYAATRHFDLENKNKFEAKTLEINPKRLHLFQWNTNLLLNWLKKSSFACCCLTWRRHSPCESRIRAANSIRLKAY